MGNTMHQVKEGVQVQGLLRSCNIDKDFCQANAIKYLARFGKKDGRNRKDLLKENVHYIVLLMDSENKTKAERIKTNSSDIESFNGA